MARRICITPGCEFYAEPGSDGCVYCMKGEIPETEARQRLRQQNRETPAETAAREKRQIAERKELNNQLARQEQIELEHSRGHQNQKAIVSTLKIGQYVCNKSVNKIGKISRIRLDSKITVDLTFEDIPTEETSPLQRLLRLRTTSDHVDVLNLVVDLTEAQLTWIKEHNEKIANWEASQRAKFLSLLGNLEIGQTKELINEPKSKLIVQRKSPAEISHQVSNKTGYWQNQDPGSVPLYGSRCPLCNSEMTLTHIHNDGDLGKVDLADVMTCTSQNCGCVRSYEYEGPSW